MANTLYKLQEIGAIKYKKIAGKDEYEITLGLTIVFMSPFYNFQANTSLALFTIFIDLQKLSPNQVFVLSESSVSNYALGVSLTQKFRAPGGPFNKYIITMLEPSYIAYPYSRPSMSNGFIISGSNENEQVTLPESKSTFNIRELKTNAYYGNTVGIVFKPKTSNTGFKEGSAGTFSIRSHAGPTSIGALNYEDDLARSRETCDGYIEGTELHSYGEIKLNRVPNSFTIASSISTPPSSMNNQPVIIVINLQKYDALCSTVLGDTTVFKVGDKFIGRPELSNVVGVNKVEINGDIFSIRGAEAKGDWLQSRFSIEEARFLSTLHITPNLLYTIYNSNDGFKDDSEEGFSSWQEPLANFMATMVESKCLTETQLLTKHECFNIRQFLNKIDKYLIENSTMLDLLKEREENEIEKEYNFLVEEQEEFPKAIGIAKEHLEEVNQIVKGEKFTFGTGEINLFTDISTGVKRHGTVVIGINDQGMYKFYKIYTGPISGDVNSEEVIKKSKADLLKRLQDLPNKYSNYNFIY